MTPLLVLLGTIAGAWYLLIVRPQKEQQTRHGRLVDRLQVGDHVLTVGGIYGRVVAIEQATVVLELAPGLTSRIATDGIARIVHGGEAALPPQQTHAGAAAPATSPQAMEDEMHQHHDPHHQQQHQQPAQPQQFTQPVLPPQPFAQPAMAPQQHAVQQAPTFEPRPWGDVQPHGVQQHQPLQQPMPQLQYAQQPQPVAYQQPQPVAYQQPQPVAYAQPQPVAYQQPVQQQPVSTFVPPAPPQMPVLVPFAQQPAPIVQQPVHYAPAPKALVQPTQQLPVVHQHAAPPAPAQVDERRHSRAPKGMGSSLRLDDPTLRDTIARARDERANLADEYRKLTAPLVDVGEQQQHAAHAHHAAAQPQFVGHDANGVALFATPGVPGVHPIEQYPATAAVPPAASVPRPGIPQGASVDPALQTAAFQRRAPYAPQQHDSSHAHAHTHA